MKPKHWLVFLLLGAIWSSSFMWIKIAVQEVGPITLVAFRVLFGLLFGNPCDGKGQRCALPWR